jgi:hypothetical protein
MIEKKTDENIKDDDKNYIACVCILKYYKEGR